jgi:hypothetical protein
MNDLNKDIKQKSESCISLKKCQGELVEPGMLYITRLRQAQTDTIFEQ